MRNRFTGAIIAALAVLVFSSAIAPMAHSQSNQQADPSSRWRFNPQDFPEGGGGPAPKRDLTGTWAGPGSSPLVPRAGGKGADKPELTPYGEKLMSQVKPIGKYSPAGTNDPHARYCDPVGFPQNAYTEARGLTMATMPDRVIILLQYMNVWREVWTDGRPLPTTVGGTGKDALDPTYNGYSVGHWEDDNTFVVDTTGMDDRTWITGAGYPHSVNAHVQERYTRIDRNDLRVSLTIDDPKVYTKPWSLGTYNYRWIPNQKFDDFACIPSEVIKYLSDLGDPAGSDPSAEGQRIGGR
jgi:hypothetical protein